MPNVITVDGPDGVRLTEREKLIRFTCKLSGAYVQHTRKTAVGEVIDLTKLVGANAPNQFWGINGPKRVYVLNTGETGFSMSIVPGVDNLHWLLVIFSSVNTELAAGAYPAGLLADADILIESSGRPFD